MKITSLILISLLALLNIACDPAIYYRPKDWSRVSIRHWSKSFEQFDLELRDAGGLIGHTSIAPELFVRNRSKSTLVLSSAILKTQKREYVAERVGAREWKVVPGETKRFIPSWKFAEDEPIYKVLTGDVEIKLLFQADQQQIAVTIPMIAETE